MFHTAKIQNWKQFTTDTVFGYNRACCVSHCKDTKLKAIHNYKVYLHLNCNVVFHTAKIQNWKQFTTQSEVIRRSEGLCFTLQRYKIESNSQLSLPSPYYFLCCVSHCKDTKLKAIHNEWRCFWLLWRVVFHTAKIQNWKQFTTSTIFLVLSGELCFTLQRYKIESNSQLLFCYYSFCHVVFHTAKIQNWKQFTTGRRIRD